MPTPYIVKIDTLDLNKNRAVGVSIPFNGPGVFNLTYDTKTQLKSNLFNLLLTNQNERLFNPLFGSNIRKQLFEGISSTTEEDIRNNILQSVERYIPQIHINSVDVVTDPDANQLSVSIDYELRISGAIDQIQIIFE
mgnify:CR=1 FL=1